MKFVVAVVALLVGTVPALAQTPAGPAPPWSMQPWPHFEWPGYCAPPPLVPADHVQRNCDIRTPIPPFSIDGGIGFRFPVTQSTFEQELAQRRSLLINVVFGASADGQLPNTMPNHVYINVPVGEDNFTPWPPPWRGDPPGTNGCARESALLRGNPRTYSNGPCIPTGPQAGENEPPRFNNHNLNAQGIAVGGKVDYVDMIFPEMTPAFPQSNAALNGTSGERTGNWVYKPIVSNSRFLMWISGHATAFNWRSVGAAGGGRGVFQRALNEGFTISNVMMGRGGAAGISGTQQHVILMNNHGVRGLYSFFEPVNEMINYYDATGSYENFNMAGSSGGGWTGCSYPAIDPRIKVVQVSQGCLPGYAWSAGLWTSGNFQNDGIIAIAQSNTGGDDEQYQPQYYSIAGFIDLSLMVAAGKPDEKFFENTIQGGDGMFDNTSFLGMRNRNLAAWQPNQARCANANPCNQSDFYGAINLAVKTSGLVPPQNYIGQVNVPGAEELGHACGTRCRRDLFTNLWQAGPKGPARRQGAFP